jgi:predicted Zn finger-like uncharacterized protein
MVSDSLTDASYHRSEPISVDSPMLMTCTKCAACYRVDSASLGAAGRSVRCVRCRRVWFARNPDAFSAIANAHRIAVTAYVAGVSTAEAGQRSPGSSPDRAASPSSLPELELKLDAERAQIDGLTEVPHAEVSPAPSMASREEMPLPGLSSEPVAA